MVLKFKRMAGSRALNIRDESSNSDLKMRAEEKPDPNILKLTEKIRLKPIKNKLNQQKIGSKFIAIIIFFREFGIPRIPSAKYIACNIIL